MSCEEAETTHSSLTLKTKGFEMASTYKNIVVISEQYSNKPQIKNAVYTKNLNNSFKMLPSYASPKAKIGSLLRRETV